MVSQLRLQVTLKLTGKQAKTDQSTIGVCVILGMPDILYQIFHDDPFKHQELMNTNPMGLFKLHPNKCNKENVFANKSAKNQTRTRQITFVCN